MARLAVLVLLGACALGSQVASAQQSVGWSGPPCQNGYYVACSQEPPVSLDHQPCYVSHIANYVPDRVQQRIIAVCQAAKAALADPPKRTLHELLVVESRVVDLAATARDDPDDAAEHADAVRSIAADNMKLRGRIAAYGPSGSPSDLDPVSNALDDIVSDSSVLGGMD